MAPNRAEQRAARRLDPTVAELADTSMAVVERAVEIDQENQRLLETIAAIKAKIKEAMGECGTSSTTHHLLRAALEIGGNSMSSDHGAPAPESEEK